MEDTRTPVQEMSPDQALGRLMEGNARFSNNIMSLDTMATRLNRQELLNGQHPFAVIFSCSDSRVPAEILFDQGLGDLFVIRIAGPVVDSSQIASIEFATELLGVPIVMVLGHTGCGAIKATLDEIINQESVPTPHLGALVDHIRPVVAHVVGEHGEKSSLHLDELSRPSVDANVWACIEALREGSESLKEREASGSIKLIPAVYNMGSGAVELLNSLP